MPLVHVCAKTTHCKEVVIPDSNGNPVGGITCGAWCKGKAPPGYVPWKKPPGTFFDAVLPVTLVFEDTDTGATVELDKSDFAVIAAAAAKEGWL